MNHEPDRTATGSRPCICPADRINPVLGNKQLLYRGIEAALRIRRGRSSEVSAIGSRMHEGGLIHTAEFPFFAKARICRRTIPPDKG